MDSVLEKRWLKILSLSTRTKNTEVKEESKVEDNNAENQSLHQCLLRLKLDDEFVQQNITSKIKSDEGLPITYNPYLLQNHIKERVEQDLVDYYSQYYYKFRGLTEVADKIIKSGKCYSLTILRHRIIRNQIQSKTRAQNKRFRHS